jgi:hypothetical protein
VASAIGLYPPEKMGLYVFNRTELGPLGGQGLRLGVFGEGCAVLKLEQRETKHPLREAYHHKIGFQFGPMRICGFVPLAMRF